MNKANVQSLTYGSLCDFRSKSEQLTHSCSDRLGLRTKLARCIANADSPTTKPISHFCESIGTL